MNSALVRFLCREWLQLTLLIVCVAATLIAMPHAVEHVPMQWDLQGRVNWYAPKSWGLWALPGTMVFVIALLMAMEAFDKQRIDPSDGSLTTHGRAVWNMRIGISVLLTLVCFIQIAAALGRHPDVAHWVPVGVALLFAFLGTQFGMLKQNRYAGFRVPWTMNSEVVWEKTHRVGGRIWTISSLVMAAVWLLGPVWLMGAAGVIWLVLLIVAPLVVACQAARSTSCV